MEGSPCRGGWGCLQECQRLVDGAALRVGRVADSGWGCLQDCLDCLIEWVGLFNECFLKWAGVLGG